MVAQRLFQGVKDDFYDLVHSLNSWQFWHTVLITAIGLTFFSIGVNAILVPHKFIASGATGIALLIFYWLGKPSVGLLYWLINIPILFVGWRAMSLKYVVLSLVGVFLSGLTLQLTAGIRIPTDDPLIAAVIGGVFTGGGVGLYLRYGGSAGGLDIPAALLRRRYGIPMGTTFITVNAINFTVGGIVNHSLEMAFYTAVAMTVHSQVVERILVGFSKRRAALIVTSQPDEIALQVMRRLNRGVTFLHGSGAMSQRATRVVYTVVNMVELARLKEIIFHCDPKAFMAVSEASEVIGYRFISWADAGFDGKRTARSQRAAAQDIPVMPLVVESEVKPAAGDTAGSAPPPPLDA